MPQAEDRCSCLLRSHPRVGVVGGTHGTGAQFAEILREQGFDVRVSGRNTELRNEELARESDLLIFAPPLEHSVEIIETCVPYCTRKDQLVVDLCSLKGPQMQAMKAAKGVVVGLHPLFGPHFRNLQGQDLVLCPADSRDGQVLQDVLGDFLRSLGLRVHEMSAAEHDRLMATIQVIPHLSALISGMLFRRLGIDVQRSLDICSPVYRTELYMMGRIHSQNPSLYASIIAQNDHSLEVVEQLQSILAELQGAIAQRDVQALDGAFSRNKAYLGEFAKTAFEESQRLLEAAFVSEP